MKYQVVLTIPATVRVVVEVDTNSQQEAIVCGYDHALAAKPESVQVVKLHNDAAQLESCEPVTARVLPAEDTLPPSPHQQGSYALQRFFTPEAAAAGTPDLQAGMPSYDACVAACEELGQTRDDYMRRVVDKLGNVLHEKQNLFGRHLVVVFTDQARFDARDYLPWAGWIADVREAKKQALALLDAGKVYAVGVVCAATASSEEKLVMKLSRSALP
jgi:hypothetical protein